MLPSSPSPEASRPSGTLGPGTPAWSRRCLDFLLPPACAACGGVLPTSGGTGSLPRICQGCRARLKAPPHPQCSRCGATRGTGLPEHRICPECYEWPPGLTLARSAVVLAPPADALVYALKYGGWPGLAEDLADRMVREARSSLGLIDGERLIPVPTTPGRLRRRGYNQARVLACGVAARIGGTVVDALERDQDGGSQVSLARSERRRNVEGVFSLRLGVGSLIEGGHPVLVDDVLTTGATASAAAKVLLGGGAETVRLLTFARALMESR